MVTTDNLQNVSSNLEESLLKVIVTFRSSASNYICIVAEVHTDVVTLDVRSRSVNVIKGGEFNS